MGDRVVLKAAFGEPGYGKVLAAVLSDIEGGDVIVVQDRKTEADVIRQVALLGPADSDDEEGVGVEIMPLAADADLPKEPIEYAPEGETPVDLIAELDLVISRDDFDPKTIFVVADRSELEILFQVAKRQGKDGQVRGTIGGSNLIVTSLEELVEVPKPHLEVKLDPRQIQGSILEGFERAGFAVGFRRRKARLGYVIQEFCIGDKEVLKALARMEITLTGEDGVTEVIGEIGQVVEIALPIPPEEMPEFKFGSAKKLPEVKVPVPGGSVDKDGGKNIVG